MTIRNILVVYNGLENAEAALRSAILMQKKYDAHLTGIVAHGGLQQARKALPWMPENVRDVVKAAESARAEEIRQSFFKKCDAIERDKIHWIDCADTPDKGIAAYSRLFDITVLGVGAANDEDLELEYHPDRIALMSGRPVLVIPAEYQIEELGEIAMVCWDGSRAAARALFEAMNILETKSIVEIVSVDADEINLGKSDALLAEMLHRHSVEAKVTRLNSGKKTVSEVLMKHALDAECSILVLGAYEHSKFRENLFGGTTTKIVQDTQVPILVAY